MSQSQQERQNSIKSQLVHFLYSREDVLSDMVCLAGIDGYFKHVNKAFEHILGYTNEELLAQPFLEFIHPDDRKATQDQIKQLMEGGVMVQFNNRYHCKDGSYKWLEWNASALVDEGLVYASARDVTQRKNLEYENRILSAFPEMSPNPVMRINAQLEVVYGNDASRPIIESVGRTMGDRVPSAWQHFVRSALSLKRAIRFQIVVEKTIYLATVKPDQKNEFVYMYLQDITDLKLAYNELRENDASLRSLYMDLQNVHKDFKKSQSQLAQNEKMAHIGQLAAGIAHEINNPMSFISSNIRTLEEYFKDIQKILSREEMLKNSVQREESDTLRKMAQDIDDLKEDIQLDFICEDIEKIIEESKAGVDRIKSIVFDLRTFGRDEDVWERVSLESIIDSILRLVESEVKFKANVVQNYGNTPIVLCNSRKLGQVFMNLMVNAAHAIEDKGTITITTYDDDENVYAKFEDTGKGINKEDLKSIFDPFYTTKPSGVGTGLGLSVSNEIVRRHNGSIDVDSELGKGTAFCIRIPKNQSQPIESDDSMKPPMEKTL